MMFNFDKIIMENFEFEKLDPSKRQEVIQRFYQIILQGAIMKILPDLSEEEGNRYLTLIENQEDPDKIILFFHEVTPHFDEIVYQETASLKETLIQFGYCQDAHDYEEMELESSKSMDIGLKIVRSIAYTFWTILGFLFWIPLLFRVIAGFCTTLVYNMVVHNPNQIVKSQMSLKLGINFFYRGYEAIQKTTSSSFSNKSLKSDLKEEFDLPNFLAQLLWTLIFWGTLILPFL